MTKKREILNKTQGLINNEKLSSATKKFGKKKTDSFSSVTSKDNFSFLIDMVLVLRGSTEIQKIATKLLNNTTTIGTTITNNLIAELKKTYNCDNPFLINPKYTNIQPGFEYIKIPVNQIDYFGKLLISPTTPEGNFIYESSPTELNNFLSAVVRDSNIANQLNYNNILTAYFEDSFETVNVVLDSKYANQPVTNLIEDLFASTRLISNNNVLGNLFDVESSLLTKNIPEKFFTNVRLLNKLTERIKTSCVKTVNDSDIGNFDPSEDFVEINALLSEISLPEFYRLGESETTDNRVGKLKFYSCSPVDIELGDDVFVENMSEFISIIKNNGDKIQSKQIQSKLKQAISAKAKQTVGDDPNTINSIVEEFFSRVLTNYPLILVGSLLSPKFFFIIRLIDALFFNQITELDLVGVFKKFIGIFYTVIKDAIATVFLEIYKVIKADIGKLVTRVAKQIVTEQLNANTAIYRNLVSLLRRLDGVRNVVNDAKDCDFSLDQIISLLNINVRNIPIGIPAPLLLASKLRGGISETRTFVKYQEKMQASGLEMGPLPDGSDNPVILSMKLMIESIYEEFRENLKVEVTNQTPITQAGATPGIIKSVGVIK